MAFDMPHRRPAKPPATARAELGADLALLEGLQELLSKRALIPGEDATLYDEFLARARQAIGPNDIVEHIWVKDIVDLVWEIARWRRLRDATFAQAHRQVLRDALPDLLKDNSADEIGALVIGWALGKRESVERVDAILRHHQLDIDALMARVLDRHLGRMERVDQLIAGAELRRDSILREIEPRRHAVAERIRLAIERGQLEAPAALPSPERVGDKS
jgi:hypothetical protein